ncbi:MAG: beta-D-glucuronidase [Lentisphaerae bacterium ADurb.Bin242]|nr:MAG: beta-D-glucuronidase [Lentisphaerae bacterium ADurb.Bin242]
MSCKILFLVLFAASAGLWGAIPLSELKSEKVCRQVFDSSENEMLRRRAFLFLLDATRNSDEILKKGLSDRDPVIRKKALYEYFTKHRDAATPELKKLTADPDYGVSSLLTQCAARLKDRKTSDALLMEIGKNTRDQRISKQVNDKTFPFKRVNIRLKDRADWDFDIVKVKSIPLPQAGYRFILDPENRGHLKNYFADSFNDSAWTVLKMGSWAQQGFAKYKGYAWYRIRFQMPEKIDSNAVEMAFDAVDESAWVWLNGTFVGAHDEGPNAWDQPFCLDMTREIKWNAENILTIRVFGNEGGVIKPVRLDVLK